jgi:putative endopeptidase
MFKHIALSASLIALAASPALAKSPAHGAHAGKVPADRTDGWGAAGIQTQWVDHSVKPGDDFNRFVNGKWIDATEIPADRSRFGSFDTLSILSETRMHTILDELMKRYPEPGSDAQRVSDAYTSFMDVDGIEKSGIAPLQPLLTRIKAAQTPDDLVTLFAEPGIASPLGSGVGIDAKNSSAYAFSVRQAPLGLGDRDYYLVDSVRNKAMLSKYKDYLTFIYSELGWADPAKTTDAVVALETKMAAANWDRALGRNRNLTYNKLTQDEFAALAPEVPLKAFLAKAGAGAVPYVIVGQLPPTKEELDAEHYTPEMAAKLGGGVPALAHMIASEPAQVWQAWMAKNLVVAAAPVLPKRFDDANFAFYGKFLGGQPEQKPRWKRGIAYVEGALGELVGKVYAQQYFPPQNKAAMSKLVANLRGAMAANLAELKWMGPETRVQAKAKLDAFTPKIGYPDKYKTYPGLSMTKDSAFANSMAAGRWANDDQISRLGKPVDRSEWSMLPETVNAYYNPPFNEIVFPAAILQPPFFNLKADDAVNYGGIGAVIGHEMGHGFDDQGSKSDGTGNLRDWWTKEDKAAFDKLTNALVDQYNGHCPLDDGKTCINGRLTLGENIGDLGGLSLAYRAYHLSLKGKKAPVVGGFTGDQRFFMAFAQVWREKIREAQLRQRLTSDPHSPAQFRINGIVPNFSEWYAAFGVKPGDKLYLPPEKRLRIW